VDDRAVLAACTSCSGWNSLARAADRDGMRLGRDLLVLKSRIPRRRPTRPWGKGDTRLISVPNDAASGRRRRGTGVSVRAGGDSTRQRAEARPTECVNRRSGGAKTAGGCAHHESGTLGNGAAPAPRRCAASASPCARRTRMPSASRRAPGAGIRLSLPPARHYPVLDVPPGSATGFRCVHVGRVIAGRALSASSCA